jgi:hypothetical protein
MGGNAFPNMGAISIDEIHPTLEYIYNKLDINYRTEVLGSVGKKPFSGDIDIAVEVPEEQQGDFVKLIRNTFGFNNVKKIGKLCSTFTDIQEYDPTISCDRPRTGIIQVDFIMGDVDWLKFFYHSPNQSIMKGAHRNIAISTLAGFTDRVADPYLDGFDRPIYVKRWKWSPISGLLQVERRSRRAIDTGKWLKKQDERVLSKSYWKPEDAKRILFKDKLNLSYFDSCESVIEATKKLYDGEYCESIFKQMAHDLHYNHNVGREKHWIYPPEVDKYIK